MKALLTAIQTQLRTDLTYVRDKDVFISKDEALVPDAAKSPFVGLKDGAISRTRRPGGALEIEMTVRVVIWVKLQKDQAGIIGDSSASKKGVLDIADDIYSALNDNLLSISGMQDAFCPDETASEMMGDETEQLQRKIMDWQYLKQS
jgi:hypothetical protein